MFSFGMCTIWVTQFIQVYVNFIKKLNSRKFDPKSKKFKFLNLDSMINLYSSSTKILK